MHGLCLFHFFSKNINSARTKVCSSDASYSDTACTYGRITFFFLFYEKSLTRFAMELAYVHVGPAPVCLRVKLMENFASVMISHASGNKNC
jgi:hypothetical protein